MKAPPVPLQFLNDMQNLLGSEFDDFQAIYHKPSVSGIRANTLKTSPQSIRLRLPYNLEPVTWTNSGFHFVETPDLKDPPPGKHPYHCAGLYYIQEPSAMLAAEILQPEPGEKVLDLCAAPGGKATHLASLMHDQGLLVANEIHSSRAWELAGNLERWGVRNTVITNQRPARLAELCPGFFDKVLVDAPCSGEGMFRKSEAARRDWSHGLVASCALRQAAILHSAVAMLKPGGKLAYSTCTFNPLENEAVIARLLLEHPEMEMMQPDPPDGVSSGRPDWLPETEYKPGMEYALRLWPHKTRGEGHFLALLKKKMDKQPSIASEQIGDIHSLPGRRLSRNELAALQDFFQDTSSIRYLADHLDESRLINLNDQIYQLPVDCFPSADAGAIRPGWWLGTLKHGEGTKTQRFIPSHALALSQASEDDPSRLVLPVNDRQIRSFLHGEILQADREDGWVLVCVEEFALGWGKIVDRKVKNYYPRGLRFV